MGMGMGMRRWFDFGSRFLALALDSDSYSYSPPPPTPLLGIHTYRVFVINPDPDLEPFHSARSGFLRLIRLRLLPVSLDPLQLCLFAHCSLFTVRRLLHTTPSKHTDTQTQIHTLLKVIRSLSLLFVLVLSRPVLVLAWFGSFAQSLFFLIFLFLSFPFPSVRPLSRLFHLSYLFRRSAGFSISISFVVCIIIHTSHRLSPVLPYFPVLPSFHPTGLLLTCPSVLPLPLLFSCSHSPVLPLVLSCPVLPPLSCPPTTVTTLSCPHCTYCIHPSQSSFS